MFKIKIMIKRRYTKHSRKKVAFLTFYETIKFIKGGLKWHMKY